MLFFVFIDEDDFIFSLFNDIGEVVLEQVGKLFKEVIVVSLGDFLVLLIFCQQVRYKVIIFLIIVVLF